MSRRITAGNDVPFRWAVKLQGKPFDLSGKDVKVYVINSRGEIPVARLTIEGNEVSGVFEGRYQTRLGEHSLILRVNEGRPEMKTAAVANVFELVQWSADAGGSDEGDVIVAPIVLESEITAGILAEYTKKDEFDSAVQTLSDQLEQKVNMEDGKALSTNDFTNALKAKLESLSNYDDTELHDAIADLQAKDTHTDEKLTELSAKTIMSYLHQHGYYSNAEIGKEVLFTSSESFRSEKIKVLEGESYLIKGYGYGNARLWATLDKDGIIIRNSQTSSNTQELVTIEANEVYLVANSETINLSYEPYVILQTSLIGKVNAIHEALSEKDDQIDMSILGINKSISGLQDKLGYELTNSVMANPSGTLNCRIDWNFSVGEEITISIEGQECIKDGGTMAIVSDGFKTLYKTAPMQPLNVVLAKEATYIGISINAENITSMGEVTLKVSKVGTEIRNIENSQDELRETIQHELGVSKFINAEPKPNNTFTRTIEMDIKAGLIAKIDIEGQECFKDGGVVAFVSDGFKTIYKYAPFAPFTIEPTTDITYVQVSVEPGNVVANGNVTFSLSRLGKTTKVVTYLEEKERSLFSHISRPIITIIDDDTIDYDAVKLFHDVCVKNGIVGTYAALPHQYRANNILSLMKEYEQEGFHFAIHGYTQNEAYHPSTFDAKVAESDFVKGLRAMQEDGLLDFMFWVVPYGTGKTELQSMAKKWGCHCAVSISQNDYVGKFEDTNRFHLPRPGFNPTDISVTFAQIKTLIDEVAANNGWLLLGTHIYNGWTEELLNTRFAEMVQYAKNAGLTFVTLNEGYRQFEPVFMHNEMY